MQCNDIGICTPARNSTAMVVACRDKVQQINLPTQEAITGDSMAPLTSNLPLEVRKKMETFIAACYQARC